MLTNSSINPVSRKKTSREILATTLSNIVSTNKQSIEQVDKNAWKFKNIEIDSKVNDYLVKLNERTGKSGKIFVKRELYRVLDNGTEQKVELGEFKKAYLYKIVRGLTTTKTPRVCISRDHTKEIFQMRDYIKAHQSDFTIEGNAMVGKVPQGDIRLELGYLKSMKNGHKRIFGRKLYLNGELYHEGGELIHVVKAMSSRRRGKKPKAI